jgi:hypothetical protein
LTDLQTGLINDSGLKSGCHGGNKEEFMQSLTIELTAEELDRLQIIADKHNLTLDQAIEVCLVAGIIAEGGTL